MTPNPKAAEWRERKRNEATARPTRKVNVRFAPMNALTDGLWLPELSGREFKVWFILYRHARPDGRVRISHGTIARLAGIRREDAARTTKGLERRALVRVLVRGRTVGQSGKRTANEYEVLVPEPRANSGDGDTIAEDE
jgi:hypothetical protein